MVSSLISGRRFRLLRVYRLAIGLLMRYGLLRLVALFRSAASAERAMLRFQVESARRVRRTIHEVQGLFVKVGQMVSVLTHFLPAEFRAELEGLQDHIPPRPLDEIRQRLAEDLGATPEALFAEFDPVPLASASLAQVHAARLEDGRRVAVKVQHLDIEELARLDLRTIRHILILVQVVLRVRGVTTAFAELEEMIHEELDFAREAEHIEAIRANFATEPRIDCPEVIHELSTCRVLSTEFIDGDKITDRDALIERGLVPEAVAERVLEAYCRMIFIDGLYHADPHPGNILVRPDGTVVFIDFGAVGRLSTAMKDGIPKFLEGVLRRDRERILRALEQMGFVHHGGRRRAGGEGDDTAERVIDYFYTRFLEHVELDSWNLQEVRFDTQLKFEIMSDLARLGLTLGELTSAFQVPKEWVLLQRTLVLILGVSTQLHPEMRPMTVIRPYLETFVLGEDRDWAETASRVVKDLALSVLTIPDDLRRLLGEARRGEARLRVQGVSEGFQLLYAFGQQALFAGLAVISGLGAVWTLKWRWAWILGSLSVVFVLLFIGAWRSARRWQRELRRGSVTSRRR